MPSLLTGHRFADPRALPYWFASAGLAAAYFGAARLGVLLASLHGTVSPVWPAAGVAIGGLLIFGARLWPAVFLGAFASNFLSDVPWPGAFGMAGANVLGALAGRWLWRRVPAVVGELGGFGPTAAICAAALGGSAVAATGGVAMLGATGVVPWNHAAMTWITWFTGDVVGALVVAPLIVAVATDQWKPAAFSVGNLARGAVLLAVVAGSCAWVFYSASGALGLFVVFPVLLLASWWFGEFATLLTSAAIVTAGVVAAVLGRGPFMADTFNQRLVFLETFCAAIAVVANALGAFRRAGPMRLPAAVMLLGWLVSGGLFAALQRERFQFDQLRFDSLIADATQRVQLRMAIYENALRVGAGVFAREDTFDEARWREFVAGLDFTQRFPGFQGLGVIVPVPHAAAAEFERSMSGPDRPPFRIHPLADVPAKLAPRVADPHLVVTHFEPSAATGVAPGLDLGSERNRRRAAEDAADTNAVCLSRRIELAGGESGQLGMLFLLPVFPPGPVPEGAAARRRSVRAWVFASIATKQLMASVLEKHAGDLDLRLYESSDPRPEWLLFSTRPERAPDDWPAAERHTRFRLAGQTVTAMWNRSPGFVPSSSAASVAASVSLALGAVLLGGVVMILQRSKREAQELVALRTSELKATAARVETVLERADCLLWDATVTIDGADWKWDFHVQPSGLYKRLFGARTPSLEYGLWYQLEIPEQAEMDARSRAAFRNGANGYDHEFRVIDGESLVWLREKVSIVATGPGRHEVAAVVTDVTQRHLALEAQRAAHERLQRQIAERERAEKEAQEARAVAETANRAKSEFLATMSHEIRTPLNGVLGFTDLLGESSLTAEQREWVSILRASGRSLLAIIHDVLDFSKIEAGKIELERVVFDARQTVEEVGRLVAASAAEKGLALQVSLDPALPARLRGDPGRFRQVLLNLAANAVKFTAHGEVRLGTRWAGSGDEGSLLVEVADTGIGIPPENRARLFQKFSQADGSMTRRFGGTGLGLAISKQLVELMGGEIGVQSHPGRGSTFWFRVPFAVERWTPEPERPAADPASVPAANAAGSRPALRVLLAEDVEFNRRLAVLMLTRFGCEITHAQNGREAVELTAAHEFDLVFMDCQMPELDGFAATREIRAREQATPGARRLPIVAMTANAVQGDRERCLEAGMDDYLSKPISLESVRGMLDRWAARPAATAG